ncbi:MAG: IS4 family transposase [Chloroflexota bacterium]
MSHPSPSTAAPAGEAVALSNIEAFLEEALSDLRLDALEDRRPGPGRPRMLPALCLWAGLLVCVLRGFESQRQLWRLLVRQGLWRFGRVAISDQALYNRLARAGTAPLEGLFAQVSRVLAARLAPFAQTSLAPFAPAVVALDASTLDKLARLLPALRGLPVDAKALLAGQVAALFDVRIQQWRALTFIPDAAEHCKVAARGLLTGLAPGTLVLADLGYFGFAWFDDLSEAGFRWVSRLRAKTSYQVIHTFYQQDETFDGVVWLGAHAADRAAHAVRLVQFRAKGVLCQYLTNVLDPTVLPPRELACLYARRWDIELAFSLVKEHLHLPLLWASKQTVVLQQVWAVFTIAQVFQALRLEIAARAGVDPFEVSMPLLVQEFPDFLASEADPIAAFIACGRQVGYIRPSTRTRIQAPDLPPAFTPLPPALPLIRTPRYAQRRADPGPRPHRRHRANPANRRPVPAQAHLLE